MGCECELVFAAFEKFVRPVFICFEIEKFISVERKLTSLTSALRVPLLQLNVICCFFGYLTVDFLSSVEAVEVEILFIREKLLIKWGLYMKN